MNRVWTALLLLATVVVAGAVVFVLVHDDPVPGAGQSPNLPSTSASVSTPPTSTTTGTGSSGPSGSSSSGTPSGSNASGSNSSGESDKHQTIAFLGDNWTKGQGTSDQSKRFTDVLGAALGAKILVAGEAGGGYAKQGTNGDNYRDLLQKVIDAKPTMVVVSGGRNDISDDHGTLTTDAQKVFSELASKLPNAKLVAVAPFWGDSDHPSDLTFVADTVKSAVEDAGGTYLDLPDPLHNHPEWMADDANPNDDGNKAIADALKPKLQPLLAG